MAGESRPSCIYAVAGLKRNSTMLMVVMCMGIAFALYGVYVQTRSQSNPNYVPTMSMATSWMYHNVGQHIVSPGFFMNGGTCSKERHHMRNAVGHGFMRYFVLPITRYSGLMNGLINLVQIMLLKVYCKSICGTNMIIYMSAFGIMISMICLAGSISSCRLMCISCLGVHHAVIIYLAQKRKCIIRNILCPPENLSGLPTGSCSFGSSMGGKTGTASGASSARPSLTPTSASSATQANKHTSTCVTRRTGSDSQDKTAMRRRSNRT